MVMRFNGVDHDRVDAITPTIFRTQFGVGAFPGLAVPWLCRYRAGSRPAIERLDVRADLGGQDTGQLRNFDGCAPPGSVRRMYGLSNDRSFAGPSG